MVRRLKRWESPRQKGRNIKGRGGTARLRQLRKQQKMLRKKLTAQEKGTHGSFFLCMNDLLLPDVKKLYNYCKYFTINTF